MRDVVADDLTDEHVTTQLMAARRMAYVDSLPPEVRECVHEFGVDIVRAFLDHGVTRPKSIRHLVKTILFEMTGSQPTNYTDKAQMDRRAAVWLAGGGYLVVPKIPTRDMVDASISALDDAGIAHTGVERRKKHAVRLIHANVAGHAGIAGKVIVT